MSPDGIDTSSIPLLCSGAIQLRTTRGFHKTTRLQVRFRSILSGGYWGAGCQTKAPGLDSMPPPRWIVKVTDFAHGLEQSARRMVRPAFSRCRCSTVWQYQLT